MIEENCLIYIAPFEAKACQDARQLFVPSTATLLLAVESCEAGRPCSLARESRSQAIDACRLFRKVRALHYYKIGSFYVHLVDLKVVAGGVGEDCAA